LKGCCIEVRDLTKIKAHKDFPQCNQWSLNYGDEDRDCNGEGYNSYAATDYDFKLLGHMIYSFLSLISANIKSINLS